MGSMAGTDLRHCGSLGNFRLEITSSSLNPPLGQYEALLTDLRRPRPDDRIRLNAERNYMDAESASHGDAQSQKEAIAKWKASLEIWQSLGDNYEQGLVLTDLGSAWSRLGEKQMALDDLNRRANPPGRGRPHWRGYDTHQHGRRISSPWRKAQSP